jgi:hypothetical protein
VSAQEVIPAQGAPRLSSFLRCDIGGKSIGTGITKAVSPDKLAQ